MAGKKKITVELIEESTKPELLDIAKRLGFEDQVTSKMLKPEVYDLVLSEFLDQQEAKGEDGTEAAAPAASDAELDMSADAIRARKQAARSAAKDPEPEEEPEDDGEAPAAPPEEFTYHTQKGISERQLRPYEVERVQRQLGISPARMLSLEATARDAGEASFMRSRYGKRGLIRIKFIVRAAG